MNLLLSLPSTFQPSRKQVLANIPPYRHLNIACWSSFSAFCLSVYIKTSKTSQITFRQRKTSFLSIHKVISLVQVLPRSPFVAHSETACSYKFNNTSLLNPCTVSGLGRLSPRCSTTTSGLLIQHFSTAPALLCHVELVWAEYSSTDLAQVLQSLNNSASDLDLGDQSQLEAMAFIPQLHQFLVRQRE